MQSKEMIGVVGAGTMGNGIAHVIARSGLAVVLVDSSATALERGLATIRKNLAREVSKGKLAETDAAAAVERVTLAEELGSLAGAERCD